MARYRHLYILLQVNSPAKKFSWVVDGLGVGENYVWYRFIVVIIIELGGAEVGGGWGDFKVITCEGSCYEGPTFYVTPL